MSIRCVPRQFFASLDPTTVYIIFEWLFIFFAAVHTEKPESIK